MLRPNRDGHIPVPRECTVLMGRIKASSMPLGGFDGILRKYEESSKKSYFVRESTRLSRSPLQDRRARIPFGCWFRRQRLECRFRTGLETGQSFAARTASSRAMRSRIAWACAAGTSAASLRNMLDIAEAGLPAAINKREPSSSALHSIPSPSTCALFESRSESRSESRKCASSCARAAESSLSSRRCNIPCVTKSVPSSQPQARMCGFERIWTETGCVPARVSSPTSKDSTRARCSADSAPRRIPPSLRDHAFHSGEAESPAPGAQPTAHISHINTHRSMIVRSVIVRSKCKANARLWTVERPHEGKPAMRLPRLDAVPAQESGSSQRSIGRRDGIGSST